MTFKLLLAAEFLARIAADRIESPHLVLASVGAMVATLILIERNERKGQTP